jgi:hypothetical protein
MKDFWCIFEKTQTILNAITSIMTIVGVIYAFDRFKIRWRTQIYINDKNKTFLFSVAPLDIKGSKWLASVSGYPRKWGLYTFVDGVLGSNPKRPEDKQYQYISFFKFRVNQALNSLKKEYKEKKYMIKYD